MTSATGERAVETELGLRSISEVVDRAGDDHLPALVVFYMV